MAKREIPVMSKKVFKASSRGETKVDWLDSKHSFSFGEYHNPAMMHFGKLRVLNDDTIAGGTGFGMHPHDNMEIISIVLEGALRHRDSEGNKGTIHVGEVQVMSAGKGVHHSEQNASKTDVGKFLQIWIETAEQDITPEYSQKRFDMIKARNRFMEMVSGMEGNAPLKIHQHARILWANIDEHYEIKHLIESGQGLFAFVISGSVVILDEHLGERDALGVVNGKEVTVKATKSSTVLFIEVPME